MISEEREAVSLPIRVLHGLSTVFLFPEYGVEPILEWESSDLLSVKAGQGSSLWPALTQKGRGRLQ